MAAAAAAQDRVVVGVVVAMAVVTSLTITSRLSRLLTTIMLPRRQPSLIHMQPPLRTEEVSTLLLEAMCTLNSSGPQTNTALRLLPTILVMVTSPMRTRKLSSLHIKRLSSTLIKLLRLLHQRSGIARAIRSLAVRTAAAVVAGAGEDIMTEAAGVEEPRQSCRPMTMLSMLK